MSERAATRGLSLPRYAVIGGLVLVAAQVLWATGAPSISVWFTPILWTGYILLADGVLFRLSGASWLSSRKKEFPLLALISVGVWLIFEAYNLRLENWIYVGLPAAPFLRNLGYFWSFATIMPGVFVTSELVDALLPGGVHLPRAARSVGPAWSWFIAGAAMVTLPVFLPKQIGALLFGSVWIGFFVLLDPINEKLGLASLRARLKQGEGKEVVSLLIGGLLCGFLWELWNHQAYLRDGAYWVYIFPELLRPLGLRFGQMPLLGLLGFPPFALELFAFYVFLREMFGGDRVFGEATFFDPSVRTGKRERRPHSPDSS